MSRECYLLAGIGTSGYLGDLKKRNPPKLTGIAVKSDGSIALRFGLGTLLKVHSRDSS